MPTQRSVGHPLGLGLASFLEWSVTTKAATETGQEEEAKGWAVFSISGAGVY